MLSSTDVYRRKRAERVGKRVGDGWQETARHDTTLARRRKTTHTTGARKNMKLRLYGSSLNMFFWCNVWCICFFPPRSLGELIDGTRGGHARLIPVLMENMYVIYLVSCMYTIQGSPWEAFGRGVTQEKRPMTFCAAKTPKDTPSR